MSYYIKYVNGGTLKVCFKGPYVINDEITVNKLTSIELRQLIIKHYAVFQLIYKYREDYNELKELYEFLTI